MITVVARTWTGIRRPPKAGVVSYWDKRSVGFVLYFIAPHIPRGTSGYCLGFEYGRDLRRLSHNLRVYIGRREWVFFDRPDEWQPIA